MIPDFANHAANERTFLAWVRTGIAVIALGFVIEKFNLFVLAIGGSIPEAAAHRDVVQKHLARLSAPLADYGGVALVFGGLAIILVATWRFVRIERLLDAPEARSEGAGRWELALLSVLLLAAAGFGAYVTLG